MPQVSFIIPVYNVEEFLPACLDSVTKQTIQDIEIICIDDCSPDDSSSILSEYAQRDPRITIISFKKNMGPAAARNAGLDAARGEFIRMVDPDDFIPADSTEHLLKTAKQHNSDFVRGALMHCDRTGKAVNRSILSPKQAVKHAQMDHRMVNYFGQHWTFLYRTTVLRASNARFDEAKRNGEDTAFMIDLIPYMKKVSLILETVYFYRENSNSIVHKKREKQYYLNIFSNYKKADKQLSRAGMKGVADCFLYYNCCGYLFKNLLSSIPNNLTIDQSTTVLKKLKNLFSELNIRELCFNEKYPWQKERTVSLDMKYFILLLENDLFTEAYKTLQQYQIKTKKQIAFNKQIRSNTKKIETIYTSTSWRITAPLRYLRNIMK